MATSLRRIALRGAASCQRSDGPVGWRISGHERDSGESVSILLGNCAGVELPAQIIDAELTEQSMGSASTWQLRHAQSVQPLILAPRAVQIHREAAGAFYRALPPLSASVRARVGWWVLLKLLRLPGMAGMLRKLRGST